LFEDMAVDDCMNKAFREVVLTKHRRIDGRQNGDLRPISCGVEVMPAVHGSAYFTRGDTHVLSTITFGPKTEAKEVTPVDGRAEEDEEYFYLDYDFPPYSTGETGEATKINRRMVGHGNLAERAIRPVMPIFEKFPYLVRAFAECTASNGSSSMASACAASLALMDAGVPLAAPVAGVSVGLVTKSSSDVSSNNLSDDERNGPIDVYSNIENYVLLKDILGTEDHLGDMDFKIAGTANGITAIQLDVKLFGGVPLPILMEALNVGRDGRLEILESMNAQLK
jgi:polyribonucleotide nucleotidyltransferase